MKSRCAVCAREIDVVDGRLAAHYVGPGRDVLVYGTPKRPCTGAGAHVSAELELDIEEFPKRIKRLRTEWLFEFDDEHLDLEAEQLYLLAIGALEQAERFAKLAVLKTRQARAMKPYTRAT